MPALENDKPRFEGWIQPAHTLFQLQYGHVNIVAFPSLVFSDKDLNEHPEVMRAIDKALSICVKSISDSLSEIREL